MAQIVLEMPDELLACLTVSGQNIERALLETVALEAYREKKISTGQLRRALGFKTRMQVHAFLKAHETYLNYDLADLEHDRNAGDALSVIPAA